MAQFVNPNRSFVPGQQPPFGSQYLPRPNALPQPNLQSETKQLLRNENVYSLRLKKFLFYAPALFFLVLLVSSSVIYGLRFEKSNGTTPAAAQVLINLGESYTQNPILELRVLPKYKNDDYTDTKIRTTCKDLEKIKRGTDPLKYWDNEGANTLPEGTTAGTPLTKEELDRFEEVVFDTFEQIREGCVCSVNKYGRSKLTYHSTGYCDDKKDCQIVKNSNSVDEKIILGSLFCVRRVKSFRWKKTTERCEDFTSQDKKMRECGPNFCVSSEEDIYDSGTYKYQEKNVCPISKIAIQSRSIAVIPTTTAQKDSRTPADNTREVIHFKTRLTHNAETGATPAGKNLQIVTWREYTDRPIIDLHSSISSPQCLASDLQRPLRSTKRSFKFQQVRETGCWPYGAHVAKPERDASATYLPVYPNGLSQASLYSDNDIYFQNIPYYKDYVMSENDSVQLYAELRPSSDRVVGGVSSNEQSNCRDNGIEEVSERAKRSLQILDVVEYYSFALILSSSLGLALSLGLILFRNRLFVNPNTQFYLHIYALLNAVALFVFAIVFWNYVNRFRTSSIQKELFLQFTNNCYMYDGQVDASKHLWDLLRYVNDQIFGLITFLFVFNAVYVLAVFVSAHLRRRDRLTVCEPVKSEGLYYE